MSSCSTVESCILLYLYGSENWVLNRSLQEALESFQAELGQRVFKLLSNTVPLLVINWPSLCARALCNRLSSVSRVSTETHLHSALFACFHSIIISRMQSFQENRPFSFQARVVLKPLVSLIGRRVARISIDTHTHTPFLHL